MTNMTFASLAYLYDIIDLIIFSKNLMKNNAKFARYLKWLLNGSQILENSSNEVRIDVFRQIVIYSQFDLFLIMVTKKSVHTIPFCFHK